MNRLIDAAYYAGTRPRVHGNGFVQLDLSDTVRLHIWGHPDIPAQRTPTPIHDHMFGFSSLILRGELTNVVYSAVTVPDGFEDQGTHWPYKARVREGEDTILIPANVTRPTRIAELGRVTVLAGQSYTMEPGTIHETITPKPAASVICKTGRTLAQGGASPTVYVPMGSTPDNDFNRYHVPQDRLWRIIREVMG